MNVTGANPSNHFEELISKDILLSEKLRVKILISLLIIILAFIIILLSSAKKEYLGLLREDNTLIWVLICVAGFILYEFLIYNALRFFLKTDRKFPWFARYGNTFFEISMLSIIIIVLSSSVNSLYVLNGPAAFAYFVFIILSALRLNFRLSLFAGLIAALQFSGLGIYFINYFPEVHNEIFFNSSRHYISKGVLMLFCGVAAGLVSIQIKKRIIRLINVLEDRNEIISVFGQQVSPEIAEELLNRKEEESGVIKDVCIMFLDIRNFTSMAEKQNPKQIVAYQNKIFGLVIEIINKNKGIINQFLGDGFMATFGAPIYRGHDCQNAVNAAKEIITEIDKANKDGLFIPTRVGIGIHYGEAITGNVGSDLRKQYSITGNVVIIASRIEQLNKKFNTQILISKEVYENINPSPNHCTSLGPVKVKGREEPIEIFKLA